MKSQNQNASDLKIAETFAESLLKARSGVLKGNPLIHCITNHIAINQSANVILAAGGSPVMAEHPGEAAQITATAAALLINLGNISDARMKAMEASGKTALEKKIPSVIDLCGVSCSELRLEFARRYVNDFAPSVIKGNVSEIKSFCGLASDGVGVDCGRKDSETSLENRAKLAGSLSGKLGCTVFITGQADVIADSNGCRAVLGGTPALARATGTGCMLGALCATYIPFAGGADSAVLSSAVMGICGELAAGQSRGPAGFTASLIDNIASLGDGDIIENLKIKKL